MLLRRLSLALLFSALSLSAAAAPLETIQERSGVGDDLAADRALFPRPKILTGNIAFWRKVFGEYSRHQSVLHDIRRPERVYQVLDFRDSVASAGNQLNRLKDGEESAGKQRIGELLRQTAALVSTPDAMSEDQRRLAALFADDPSALADAASYIRSQRGLREQTADAVRISGQYLPEMEKIFAEKGMPRLLTRLPFVESSFNVNAYSKVAAAGLWQFMPSSAKGYMSLNNLKDDRRDPWRSTGAAAEHLSDDYRALRDWPLAVTAYNYGRSGLNRGMAEVGGNSLSDLIERYNNPRFGFASRNFYSEFLAATDVEKDWQKYFGDMRRSTPLRFDQVQLPRYTPWRTLVQLNGGDEETLARLNPSYRDTVKDGSFHIPAGDTVRLPHGSRRDFEAAYAALDSHQTFESQRVQYFTYKVRRGETLGAIANRYGVSEGSLKSLNTLKKGRVRSGQRLRIPNVGGGSEPVVTELAVTEVTQAPEPVEQEVLKRSDKRKQSSKASVAKTSSKSKKKAATEQKVRTHKVRPGQNLSAIAAEYDVSVSALMKANKLKQANHIQPGMKLKIPAV